MKYKCLVLDHDDTVVDSTRSIHYPCLISFLERYRPHLLGKYTPESFLEKNFIPGILPFLRDEIELNDEELALEEEYWREYIKDHIPRAYDGIDRIIREFISHGGIVAVSSHSFKCYIERDYLDNGLPLPHRIFGWELDRTKRKPSTYAIDTLIAEYSLKKEEILVVDDLKTGYDMARVAGVDFAASAWAYDVPLIADFMREHCDFYLESVDELYSLLFEREE